MKTLSTESEVIINCPKICHNVDLSITITREKYEEICSDLFEKCVPPIIMAMKDANMTVNDINEIVLVGDFTKTSMIQRMINELFQGKLVRAHELPSHFLACHGASLEAAVVLGTMGP